MKEVGTFEDLKNVAKVFADARTASEQLPAKKEKLDEAKDELAILRAELAAIPKTYLGTVDYGVNEKSALKAFYTASDPKKTAEPVYIYNRIEGDVLILKTELEEGEEEEYTKVSSSINITDEDSYLNIWADTDMEDIWLVEINYKKGKNSTSYSEDLTAATPAGVRKAIYKLASNMPSGTETVEKDNKDVIAAKQQEINNKNGEIQKINEEIAKLNTDINAVNNYKSLSITGNITIPALTAEEITAGKTLLTLGDWGSDYTINGNGYVITYPAGANGNLTGVNKGIINNLGVENGKIAQTNGGTLKIAFETTNGTTYDIYDASGAYTSASMDSALVNRARPYFGVKITKNKETGAAIYGKLEKKTDPTTVYKAEWTNAETKEKTVFYTNATYDEETEATGLSYNPAKGMANTFTYVLSNDLTVTDKFTEKNVVVKGICNNAEFTDDVAEGGRIYIPTKFTAKELTYGRDFSSSPLATVCLPFGVSAETLKEKGVETKMQFSYVETATNTYWFQHLGAKEAMKANEPYVLKFTNGFSGGKIFEGLTNIEVVATKNTKGEDINSLAVAPSNPGNGAEFLGVFASTNASQLMRGGYTLYGFINGKFSPMDAPKPEDVKMLPFRTYVRTPNENNAPAAPFILGELDEEGNIIDDGDETGVNTAVKETDAFSVKGINGALVITSEKAQNVNIYTIGGSLVKATNVEAGSVTVPVAAGMYIVNGKKVLVK